MIGNANPNGFQGREGSNLFQGGIGPGPDGADRFVGGSQTDTASYSNRTDPIVAVLGTFGTGPEGDTSNGIENLTGGSGNDTLTGAGQCAQRRRR